MSNHTYLGCWTLVAGQAEGSWVGLAVSLLGCGSRDEVAGLDYWAGRAFSPIRAGATGGHVTV